MECLVTFFVHYYLTLPIIKLAFYWLVILKKIFRKGQQFVEHFILLLFCYFRSNSATNFSCHLIFFFGHIWAFGRNFFHLAILHRRLWEGGINRSQKANRRAGTTTPVSGLSSCLSKAPWQKAACTRNNGHEQLISNSAWFKPAFCQNR